MSVADRLLLAAFAGMIVGTVWAIHYAKSERDRELVECLQWGEKDALQIITTKPIMFKKVRQKYCMLRRK